MNLCRSCDEDFGSVALFDAHRVGKHAYDVSEGMRMEPPVEDGRRCLSVEEMEERGWTRGARGRWQDPVRVLATRETLNVKRREAVSGAMGT